MITEPSAVPPFLTHGQTVSPSGPGRTMRHDWGRAYAGCGRGGHTGPSVDSQLADLGEGRIDEFCHG